MVLSKMRGYLLPLLRLLFPTRLRQLRLDMRSEGRIRISDFSGKYLSDNSRISSSHHVIRQLCTRRSLSLSKKEKDIILDSCRQSCAVRNSNRARSFSISCLSKIPRLGPSQLRRVKKLRHPELQKITRHQMGRRVFRHQLRPHSSARIHSTIATRTRCFTRR